MLVIPILYVNSLRKRFRSHTILNPWCLIQVSNQEMLIVEWMEGYQGPSWTWKIHSVGDLDIIGIIWWWKETDLLGRASIDRGRRLSYITKGGKKGRKDEGRDPAGKGREEFKMEECPGLKSLIFRGNKFNRDWIVPVGSGTVLQCHWEVKEKQSLWDEWD